MDEKELIRRIKNSFANGKSEEEISRSLLAGGYRLEYINILLKKARGRRFIYFLILPLFFIFLFMVFFGGFLTYNLFFAGSLSEKEELKNPLQGLDILFELDLKDVFGDDSGDFNVNNSNEDSSAQKGLENGSSVHIDDIEITSEFISYLLNELGAWQLKPNPITREKPVINFKIDEKEFGSVVEKGVVKTSDGFLSKPDIIFYSNKRDIVKAIISEEPAVVFVESYSEERSSFDIKKSEAELFSKGYLNLYESFES